MVNKDKKNYGTLFMCATPIGNLEDVSFRLINTLKDVFLIAAEDTRTTKKLLNKYEVTSSKLISYHDNSPPERAEYIISALKDGKDAALVSESGTPLISDPGFKLVRDCLDAGIPIRAIPGPNAAISALVMSGLSPASFIFLGFLPKAKSKFSAKIKKVANLPYTIIIYESPNRVIKTLEIIESLLGQRDVSISREITKIYEEVIRGKIKDVISVLKNRTVKGEIVIVVEGYKDEKIKDYLISDIENEFRKLLKEGLLKKEIVKTLVLKYDITRQKLYNISTKI